MEALRTLYPKIEPNQTGFISVSGGHEIYFEESGNPKGKPVLFVHGGPGVGTSSSQRSFFNPAVYRIILFDQRGCGKSIPFSSLENNTTWDLVEDIESLRKHLKVDKWVVFGGSWGSTLALTYAIKYPTCVLGLILRGIFLCRPQEISWFYQCGVSKLFPDLWEQFVEVIPKEERGDFVQAFYKRLTSKDPVERKEAALRWSGWEGGTSRLYFDPELFAQFTQDSLADSIARIECHYFIHNCFFETNNWILENVGAISHIPAVLIHGRYDMPCPLENAWALHKALPKSELKIIPSAGHSSSEPGTLNALIQATDLFGTL